MTKLGTMIISGLLFIACLILVAQLDYTFIMDVLISIVKDFFLTQLVFLYIFYKFMFKKEITGRQFVYLPASILIINVSTMSLMIISILLSFDLTTSSYLANYVRVMIRTTI